MSQTIRDKEWAELTAGPWAPGFPSFPVCPIGPCKKIQSGVKFHIRHWI